MTKRSAVLVLSVVATWLSVPAIYAESLGEIFNRVKTEFSQGDYKRSLADVDALDAASQQPAAASERPKLVGVIAFYRAANLAALGRADEAKAEFINVLDEPYFPAPIVAPTSATFGQVTASNQANYPRRAQLGVKITF